MIEIRDGRLWFYDELVDSVYPVLDYELLAGYVCPECNSVITAFCVGSMTEDLLARYRPKGKHYMVISIPEGGFSIEYTNHGSLGSNGYTRNCKFQQHGQSRGVYNCILNILGWGSLHSTTNINRFVEAIERGEYKEQGIITVEDCCGNDAPIVLFNTRQLLQCYNEPDDQILAMKLEELIASYKTINNPAFGVKPVDAEVSKIGRKNVKLSACQTALF